MKLNTLVFKFTFFIFLFSYNLVYQEDQRISTRLNIYNVYVLTELSSCFTCEVSYLELINNLQSLDDSCYMVNYTAFFSGNRNKDTLIFKDKSKWKYNVSINKSEIFKLYKLETETNFLITDISGNLIFKTNTLQIKNFKLVADSIYNLLCVRN